MFEQIALDWLRVYACNAVVIEFDVVLSSCRTMHLSVCLSPLVKTKLQAQEGFTFTGKMPTWNPSFVYVITILNR